MEDSTENMPPMEDGRVEEENIDASQEAETTTTATAMEEDVVNDEVNAPTVDAAAGGEEEVVEEKEEEVERPPPRLMITKMVSWQCHIYMFDIWIYIFVMYPLSLSSLLLYPQTW